MSRVPAVQTLLLGRRQRDRLGFGLREPAGCNAHTANGRSKHSCQVPEAQTVLGEPMVKERLRLVTSSLALQETPKDRLCLSVPLCEGRPLAGGGRGSPWPRVLLSSSSHLQRREAEGKPSPAPAGACQPAPEGVGKRASHVRVCARVAGLLLSAGMAADGTGPSSLPCMCCGQVQERKGNLQCWLLFP